MPDDYFIISDRHKVRYSLHFLSSSCYEQNKQQITTGNKIILHSVLFKNINVFTKYRMQSYQNMEIIIIFAALNSKKEFKMVRKH